MELTKEKTTDLRELTANLENLVGNTPLHELKNIHSNPNVKIMAKLEWMQFSGSVKARPAFNIFKEALEAGQLEGRTLLDASSGNTAIAYASIGSALNIPVTICLPSNASKERKSLLRALGVEIIYTSEFGSTDEAQEIAARIHAENPNKYYYANQYNNPKNWLAHYNGTAEEILVQTNRKITHFITGLGTTGSFVGTVRKLKEADPDIVAIGLQPDSAMHVMEGWKHLETAITPGIYDGDVADQTWELDSYEVQEMIKTAAQKEGMLLSPSSAANLLGAVKLANSIERGWIVTLFPDNADKYSEVLNSLFSNDQ